MYRITTTTQQFVILVLGLLAAFDAAAHSSISEIQSEMLDEIFYAEFDKQLSDISPDMSGVVVPALPSEQVYKYVGQYFQESFVCGEILSPRPTEVIPKYHLIFRGRLYGHSAFSPYAKYATNDYWQVVFVK